MDSRSGVLFCKLSGVHDARLCVLVRLCRFLLGGVQMELGCVFLWKNGFKLLCYAVIHFAN